MSKDIKLPLKNGMVSHVNKGKKYSKSDVALYSSQELADRATKELFEAHILNLDFVRSIANWAKSELDRRELPLTFPKAISRGRLLANVIYRDLYSFYIGELKFKHDSIEALLAEVLLHADIVLDELNDPATRVHAAYSIGKAETRIDFYSGTLGKQIENAKAPRKNNLNRIIKKLSTIDEPAKHLWNRFFSDLSQEFESVRESTTELRYYYTTEKGKEYSITLKTFQNKLSAARKNPDSHG
mgnify:CR=1 FL=1